MDVRIKEFEVDMQLGSKGMTLDVRDTDGTFLGDIRIGKAKLEWCKGRTHAGHGVKKNWRELIAWFKS